MGVIYILISISTLVALVFFLLFIKAVRSGQYEDVHTPSVRMLFEDELIEDTGKEKQQKNT